MSDRERLESLARAIEEERGKQQQQLRQSLAAKADAAQQEFASDKELTQAILDYCLREFRGFKLVPTGHAVAVDMSTCSNIHGIRSDGSEYVCLSIQHWGEETNDFQGIIPVIMARYRQGAYSLFGPDGKQTNLRSFDDLKIQLIEMLAGIDREAVLALFSIVRSHFPRKRYSRF